MSVLFAIKMAIGSTTVPRRAVSLLSLLRRLSHSPEVLLRVLFALLLLILPLPRLLILTWFP
ncbi:hypothetical protein CsSME_00008990 [Camellia sinensis var. sinensis]